MRQTGVVAGASLAAVAGLAAVLSSAGLLDTDDAAKAGSSALSLYGVATVVHTGADGAVLDTQTASNRLLNTGENFVLEQIFRDGTTVVGDTTQMGAICLSASTTPDLDQSASETLDATMFENNHDGAYTETFSGITKLQTRECLTDDDVTISGRIATVGPLTFVANTTASSSNWVPTNTVEMIGICKADSAGGNAASCDAPLLAAVKISQVPLNEGETLTVTYTFNMDSDST